MANAFIDPTYHQRLEFLALWMMATTNREMFARGAVEGGVQHWTLVDPAGQVDPPDVNTFFQALDWIQDVEPFLNNTAFADGTAEAPGVGKDFEAITNDFVTPANQPLIRTGVPIAQRYDEHTCPPIQEVTTILQAIANAAAAAQPEPAAV